MKIGNVRAGMRVKRSCKGCPCDSMCLAHRRDYDGKEDTILEIKYNFAITETDRRDNISPCPVSQYTPIEAGDKGDEKSQDDVLQVLCIMCGRSVPVAHEKAHRESMDCIQARKHDPIAVDTWKCHCGMTGRYIDLQEPFTGCHHCGGEVQDS